MTRFGSQQRVALLCLLVASSVFRFALVLKGGQSYFPDELRYYRWDLLKHLKHADFRGGFDYLLDQPGSHRIRLGSQRGGTRT
jgi:hypothetical protein